MLTSNFVTGANYWASNAGINMWSEFDESVIDDDFRRLKELKLDIVRVFPLWSDFQPIKMLRGFKGGEIEIRTNDESTIEHEDLEYAGLNEDMLKKFDIVLDLAEKHGLKVCVGIITGWMSGRLFCPQVLEGRNLLNDPLAIYYELRFVKEFVKRFVNRKVIVGWTSGNETDCLATVSRFEYHNWALNIYNAIRAIDKERPIMEDMHPLRREGSKMLYERHDMFEVTTVHPYAKFSGFILNEPITSMRGLLHAVAEGKAYEGITGKPCLVEEVGTLGDFVCSQEISGGFARVQAMSAWANGLTGFMWWCANEQKRLLYPPYDWNPCERELGLFNLDNTEKPVAKAFRNVKEDIEKISSELVDNILPKAKVDAVCILNGAPGATDWRDVVASYVLSKQAGFNLSYCTRRNIPDSDFYIIPSIKNDISGETYRNILNRVSNGATLLVNYESEIIVSDFLKNFGSEIQTYSIRNGNAIINGNHYPAPIKLKLKPMGAKVLVSEDDGDPAITVFNYGKGKIYFCTIPVEKDYSEGRGGKDDVFRLPYDILAEQMPLAIHRDNTKIGITVHPTNAGSNIIVAINYSPDEQTTNYTIAKGNFKRTIHGNVTAQNITIEPYGTAVFEIE